MQEKTWYSILGVDAMLLSLKNLLLRDLYNLHTGSLSIVLRCEATASVETVANNIVFMIE